MSISLKHILFIFTAICIAQLGHAQIAIQAETIYPVSGPAITNGVVLVQQGKIEKIGPAAQITIPAGYQIIKTKVLTPGLVDARTLVGISGSYNSAFDQNQLEKSSPIQPDLRAIDAYNPEEALVKVVRNFGVTTMHTGHGIGALVTGQTMVVKTKPGTVETVTLQPLSMLAMTLGDDMDGNFTSPGTDSKQIAMLRTEFLKTQAYIKKMGDKDSSKRPSIDPKLDMLGKLLQGEIKALITANTATDIMKAIRLAKEFNFKLVLNGAAEAYRLTDEIKAAKAEVILHAPMARMGGPMINSRRESAALLTAAGIPISIESGFEAYVPKSRIILFEAAQALAFGLSFDETLKSITINPAKLLGLDKRIGSIEVGKDADLVLFNGDPFEYLTKVCGVVIDGKMEYVGCN